jgi:hypothetical protein
MPDYQQRVLDSQGQFRKLEARLPGFKGYLAKEARREADKMLRSSISRQLDQQKSRLQQLSAKLATAGDLDTPPAVERVRMRLQTVSDKIRTATYGYAGFFDAATVNEPELDALYTFDNSLLDDVAAVATAVTALTTAAAGQPFADALTAVGAAIENLHTEFAKRQDVVTGGAA